ncbi:hypothetical protein ZOSMA_350G00160 [Zostera marina]|uniref:Phosphatidylinositol N-acetylglucosaminyltransferase subunit Y n=1 Tax=Zostera marina TaxID=29655 RepID=A0A0K9P6V7_ZOSMR|nr:hypothetical protein ZOSMA_350G00160 [Zostera marina]
MRNLKLAPGSISSPSTSPGRTRLWGISFILLGCCSLVAFLFASIISKFLPPFQNPFLNAIQNDRYYCLLVPLTVPILFVAVYFHWLSMKLFKHA